MIDSFVRGLLGTSGSMLLDFYVANSLWINGLVLLYALGVVLARRAFDRSRHVLIALLRRDYAQHFEQRSASSVLNTLKRIPIPWEQAAAGSSFPFITPPGSFRVHRKSPAALQRLLPLEALAELLIRS